MKYTVAALALLALLQVVYAQTEALEDIKDEVDEEIVDVEHYHRKPHKVVCIKPFLKGWLVKVIKHHKCPRGKPFGFYFKVLFKNNKDTFTFWVNICRIKHKPKLPKKIFNCGLRRGLKQCKTLGLPKCVIRHSQFLHRRKAVTECLARVLRKCSNGKVITH